MRQRIESLFMHVHSRSGYQAPLRNLFGSRERHYANRWGYGLSAGDASQSDLKQILVMRPNEVILATWWGSRLERNLTFTEAAFTQQGKGGSLPNNAYGVLTSQRLALIAEKGLLAKDRYVQDVFELQDIASVSRPISYGKIVISVHSPGGSVERVFKPLRKAGHRDPAVFHDTMYAAIRDRQAYLEAEKKRARIQYVLDFSFLRSKMEEGGVGVTTIRCPNCGSPLALPESGSKAVCGHCGSPILAQDVFEKLKGLLGNLP